MTPSCWRRPARRARANAWWISGPGVGAAGLALAQRVDDSRVTLVEIDPGLAALAAENAQANGLAGRVSAVVLDVAASARVFAAAGLAPESVTRVLMNPPLNDPARQRASPDRQRRLAHAGPDGTLAAWIKTAARLLRPGGTLTVIWRADGLAAVLKALDAAFGAVTVFPIHSRAGEPRSAFWCALRNRAGSRSRYCRGSSSTTAPASPRRRRNRCCAGAPYCRWVKSDDAVVEVLLPTSRQMSSRSCGVARGTQR
jgi:tRNA1(Val) A37 N6-methylase TrmN6